MLNIKFIENLKELKIDIKNYSSFSVPLYHGTRKHLLTLPDEERKEFFSSCDKIVSYCNTILKKDKKLVDELWKYETIFKKNGNFLHGGAYTVEKYKSLSKYEYGDFYVTEDPDTASSYSKCRNGELGDLAYFVLHFFEHLLIELPTELIKDKEIIYSYHEKYSNDERVILISPTVNVEDLFFDTGTPFNEYEDTTEYIDDYFESLLIYKNIHCNSSFRIKNPENYLYYCIKEKDFNNIEDFLLINSLSFYIDKTLKLIKKAKDIDIQWDKSYALDHFKNYILSFNKDSNFTFDSTIDSYFFSLQYINEDQNLNISDKYVGENRILLRLAKTILKDFHKSNNEKKL